MLAAEVDILVVGGGPAGTVAAAELARAGIRVTVIERRTYDIERRFGEVLPPAARPLLAQLGLWERMREDGHLPSPGIVSTWGGKDPRENDFVFTPYGHGWCLARLRFDRMLAERAERAGASVVRGVTVRGIARTRRGWSVAVRAGARLSHVRARFVIDASGRHARIARSLGVGHIRYDRLVGAVGRYGGLAEGGGGDLRTTVEAVESGWWYSAPLPDGARIAAFMTDGDLLQRHLGAGGGRRLNAAWSRLLAQTRLVGPVVAGARLEWLHVVECSTRRLSQVVGDGWLAVGDARMVMDPLSSQGVLSALDSGLKGSRCALLVAEGERDALDQYERGTAMIFERFLILRRIHYRNEGRWPLSDFWRRRHIAPAVARNLVGSKASQGAV